MSTTKHFLDFAAGLLKAKGPLPGNVIHAAFRSQGNEIDDHEQFRAELDSDDRFTKIEDGSKDGVWGLKS